MTQSVWTDWSRSFGLDVPILNAPMGGVAGGALASAVTKAGGLGMVGVGSAGTVAFLRHQTAIPRDGDRRFGVGLIAWALEREPGLLDAAIDSGPVLISVSFGDGWSWAEQVRDAGVTTATQVYDVETARRAVDAGVEILVARGSEGGGHGEHRTGTLVLLQEVLDAVSVPVLAAGGVATSRGLAAVLAAGAAGAWLGTPFATCPESLATDTVRALMVEAGSGDTACTGVFDLALGYPWPARYDERVLRNDLTDQWGGSEDDLATDAGARTALARAIEETDAHAAVVDAGQGVGLVTAVRPAAAVVDDLVSGAASLLAVWGHRC